MKQGNCCSCGGNCASIIDTMRYFGFGYISCTSIALTILIINIAWISVYASTVPKFAFDPITIAGDSTKSSTPPQGFPYLLIYDLQTDPAKHIPHVDSATGVTLALSAKSIDNNPCEVQVCQTYAAPFPHTPSALWKSSCPTYVATTSSTTAPLATAIYPRTGPSWLAVAFNTSKCQFEVTLSIPQVRSISESRRSPSLFCLCALINYSPSFPSLKCSHLLSVFVSSILFNFASQVCAEGKFGDGCLKSLLQLPLPATGLTLGPKVSDVLLIAYVHRYHRDILDS